MLPGPRLTSWHLLQPGQEGPHKLAPTAADVAPSGWPCDTQEDHGSCVAKASADCRCRVGEGSASDRAQGVRKGAGDTGALVPSVRSAAYARSATLSLTGARPAGGSWAWLASKAGLVTPTRTRHPGWVTTLVWTHSARRAQCVKRPHPGAWVHSPSSPPDLLLTRPSGGVLCTCGEAGCAPALAIPAGQPPPSRQQDQAGPGKPGLQDWLWSPSHFWNVFGGSFRTRA